VIVEDKGQSEVFTKVQELRRDSGDVMRQQVFWNPSSWEMSAIKIFEPQISKFAETSQRKVNKHVILRGDVIEKSETFEDVFIGSMIFGYGTVGYGPSRVGRVVRENPNLLEKLFNQYTAAANGAQTSWKSHTKKDRVKYLGPAFATKFAYFAARHQGSQGCIPLIADINTSWALWSLAKIPRSIELRRSYNAYVELAHRWGAEISGDHGADEIERALFDIGKDLPKKIQLHDSGS
jgi:hypothetical protein